VFKMDGWMLFLHQNETKWELKIMWDMQQGYDVRPSCV
jgi:hypothetical protein